MWQTVSVSRMCLECVLFFNWLKWDYQSTREQLLVILPPHPLRTTPLCGLNIYFKGHWLIWWQSQNHLLLLFLFSPAVCFTAISPPEILSLCCQHANGTLNVYSKMNVRLKLNKMGTWSSPGVHVAGLGVYVYFLYIDTYIVFGCWRFCCTLLPSGRVLTT